MDMLEAYARQVVSYYPARIRDDLFAETYDDLCEEFGDWQAGHPDLGEAEFLESTKEHPMKFATRLAPESSPCLVGPRFYFSFISALKVGATITVGVYLTLALILALLSGTWLQTFAGVLLGIPVTLLWVGAAILGVFVALERGGDSASWLEKWSAKDLKPNGDRLPISRAETLFDLGLSTFALLWVLGAIHPPLLIRHNGEWITELSLQLPAGFWWCAGALLAIDIGFSIYRLFRSHWSGALRQLSIATNLAWIAILLFALNRPELVQLDLPLQPELSELSPFINLGIQWILTILCGVLAADTLIHAWRWWKKR